MSWLARSIANTLLLDGNRQYDVVSYDKSESTHCQEEIDSRNGRFDHVELANDNNIDNNDEGDQGRGVKEDLSELTDTLTLPLRPMISMKRDGLLLLIEEAGGEGSGNFCDDFGDGKLLNRSLIDENLGNFCDNSDDFGDGKLLNRSLIDEAVIEEDLGRSYCNGDHEQLMKEEVEEEDVGRSCDNDEEFDDGVEGAVGVTEEALAFAHNIAHHPETWLDFPVEEEDEEGFIDFRISDSQYKHALAIERCVPTLAALRIELCPVHMSEGYFWMVYFVLLHSRLCKNDADQLSSDELVLARSTWREELKKRAKPETDWFGRSTFYLQESTLSPRGDFDPELLEDSDTKHLTFSTYYAGSRTHHATTYNETEKQIVECDEAKSADTPSGNSERDLLTFQSALIIQDDDDDGEDDWLQDTADLDGYSAKGIVVNEEDVSFSDLEEDSDWSMPIKSK